MAKSRSFPFAVVLLTIWHFARSFFSQQKVTKNSSRRTGNRVVLAQRSDTATETIIRLKVKGEPISSEP